MRTKKHIEVLLENGIHFNTVMSLSDRQVGILAEKFFKSKPMGDVEQAKKDSLKSMRAFIKRYLGVEDPDSLSDKTVLEKMKMVARHADSPSGANKITKLGADVYRIAKDLFEGNKKETNEVATYSTQTAVYDPKTDKGPLDAALNDPEQKEVTVTKDNKIAVTSGNVPNLKESGEVSERFASKAQQKLFFVKCGAGKTKEEKKWCKMRDEFAASTKKIDYKKMPEKLHPEKTVKYRKRKTKKRTDENYEQYLENRIFEMIEKHIEPSMTKGDLLKTIQEKVNSSEKFMLKSPKKNTMFSENEGMEMKRPISNLHSIGEASKEKEAPSKPGIKTPPKRKNPFKDPNPGVKEAPKAEDGKEKQKNDFMSIITSILRK